MIDRATRNRAILLGIAIWFAAAMVVHFAPATFDGGRGSVLMFALAIPGTWLTIKLVTLLVKPIETAFLPAVAWGVAAATLADALAISFIPALYAGVSPSTQFGAAWILWGVALLLIGTLTRKAKA